MAQGNQQAGPQRAILFFLLAVVLIFAIFGVVYRLVVAYQSQINAARQPSDKAYVIVAERDLYPGVTITENDVYGLEIPEKLLPEGCFLSPEYVVGRIPRERILANEFVRSERLADPEIGVGLSAIIPRSMRAISVAVRGSAAIAGFLNPGNYVDLLVTIRPDEEKNLITHWPWDSDRPKSATEIRTKTVLQQLYVLGVNNITEADLDETPTKGKKSKSKNQLGGYVTFLVTPEQAAEVAHASQEGEITLALRNDLDGQFPETTGVVINDLIEKLRPPEPVRQIIKREQKSTNSNAIIRFIRGSSVETRSIKTK